MHDLKSKTLVDQRFEIIERIGVGGMGVVYKARQVGMERPVALKVILPHLLEEQECLARFELEARALAMLDHPNICRFYAYGVWQGRLPYIAMDYLDCGDLSDLLVSEFGKLSWSRTLAIAEQVSNAVACAHAAGIIHRDLKPSNVFISRDASGEETVKVADFGLAKFLDDSEVAKQKLTRTGHTVGSPQYMSPEQIKGLPATPASDVYALGCIIYQCLFGRPPYEAASLPELLGQHMYSPNPVPLPSEAKEIPPSLLALLERALAKKPEDRYPNMREMTYALADVKAACEAVPDGKAKTLVRVPLAIPRFGMRTLIPALLTFALVLAAGLYFFSQSKQSGESPIDSGENLLLVAKNLKPAMESKEFLNSRKSDQEHWVATQAIQLQNWNPPKPVDGGYLQDSWRPLLPLGLYDEGELLRAQYSSLDNALDRYSVAHDLGTLQSALVILQNGKGAPYRDLEIKFVRKGSAQVLPKDTAQMQEMAAEVHKFLGRQTDDSSGPLRILASMCIGYALNVDKRDACPSLLQSAYECQSMAQTSDDYSCLGIAYQMLFDFAQTLPEQQRIDYLQHVCANEMLRVEFMQANWQFWYRCQLQLSELLQKSGETQQAIDMYDAAAATCVKKQHAVFLAATDLLEAASLLEGEGKFDEAIKRCEAILQMDQSGVGIHALLQTRYQLANLLMRTRGREAAMKRLQADSLSQRATVDFYLGDSARAIDELQEAADTASDPKVTSSMLLAKTRLQTAEGDPQSQYQLARSVLDKTKDPSSGVYQEAARLSFAMGKPEEAEHLYEQAVEQSKREATLSIPMKVMINRELGDVHYHLKKYDLAAQSYENAMKAAEQQKDGHGPDYEVIAAGRALALRDYPKARRYLHHFHDDDFHWRHSVPFAGAMTMAAQISLAEGDTARAKNEFAQARDVWKRTSRMNPTAATMPEAVEARLNAPAK